MTANATLWLSSVPVASKYKRRENSQESVDPLSLTEENVFGFAGFGAELLLPYAATCCNSARCRCSSEARVLYCCCIASQFSIVGMFADVAISGRDGRVVSPQPQNDSPDTPFPAERAPSP